MTIQQYINFGWLGLNEGWNKIPQIYKIGGRVILTTQEPSIAGYLLTTLYYPFILSSIVTNCSIYRRKIFGKSVEFVLFAFSLPVVLFTFSTSTYVVSLILFLFMGALYCKKISFKKIIKLFYCFFLFFLIVFCVLYKNLPQGYINSIMSAFTKIFMKGQGAGSVQTRYGFMYAGIMEFLHYPFWGVGVGNSKYVFAQFIPSWAYNSEVIHYLSIGKALGPKGFWSWLLGETGIIGTLAFILFLYSLVKNYKYLSKVDYIFKSKKVIYFKHAFFIFLIVFFLQGFNASVLFLLWQWFLFGFFIGYAHSVKKEGRNEEYLH